MACKELHLVVGGFAYLTYAQVSIAALPKRFGMAAAGSCLLIGSFVLPDFPLLSCSYWFLFVHGGARQ